MYLESMKTKKRGRNKALIDSWSLVHVMTGIGLGWIMNPLYALIIMTVWEPIEIFVLSPILARFGIDFGYESFKNSMSDIVVNAIGISMGAFLLANLVNPPFEIF